MLAVALAQAAIAVAAWLVTVIVFPAPLSALL
jgi:hypothetical protein